MVQPTKVSIGGAEPYRFRAVGAKEWAVRVTADGSRVARFADIEVMNAETKGDLVEFLMFFGCVAPFYPFACEAWGTGRIQMIHKILSDKSMKLATGGWGWRVAPQVIGSLVDAEVEIRRRAAEAKLLDELALSAHGTADPRDTEVKVVLDAMRAGPKTAKEETSIQAGAIRRAENPETTQHREHHLFGDPAGCEQSLEQGGSRYVGPAPEKSDGKPSDLFSDPERPLQLALTTNNENTSRHAPGADMETQQGDEDPGWGPDGTSLQEDETPGPWPQMGESPTMAAREAAMQVAKEEIQPAREDMQHIMERTIGRLADKLQVPLTPHKVRRLGPHQEGGR